MKAVVAKQRRIRIGVVEHDPVRLIGFRAVLDSQPDCELVSIPEVGEQQNIDLALLGNRSAQRLLDILASFRAVNPHLPIIVTGCGMNDETTLKAIILGAKGYVDAAASPDDFVRAIRTVVRGSVWAPRRVLSRFIEQASLGSEGNVSAGRNTFTEREKEVLEMLVAGRSNNEIALALCIEERTVKAHVSKLMSKSGVQNRVMLSVHAVTHSLVSRKG